MIGALVFAALLSGVVRRVNCMDAMAAGARAGLETLKGMLPPLLCMLTALSCLRHSGLTEHLLAALAPVFGGTGIPHEVLSLLILRPLSGSGSLAAVQEMMLVYGPDSPQALAGAVLCASGDTVFYVLAVYTGASGVTKTGYTVPAALFGWALGAIAALIVWPMAM